VGVVGVGALATRFIIFAFVLGICAVLAVLETPEAKAGLQVTVIEHKGVLRFRGAGVLPDKVGLEVVLVVQVILEIRAQEEIPELRQRQFVKLLLLVMGAQPVTGAPEVMAVVGEHPELGGLEGMAALVFLVGRPPDVFPETPEIPVAHRTVVAVTAVPVVPGARVAVPGAAVVRGKAVLLAIPALEAAVVEQVIWVHRGLLRAPL
jgi:hypothetical protein